MRKGPGETYQEQASKLHDMARKWLKGCTTVDERTAGHCCQGTVGIHLATSPQGLGEQARAKLKQGSWRVG